MAGIKGVKEGSIIEGILAIYIAMIFADPEHGENINKIKDQISDLRKKIPSNRDAPRIGIKISLPKDDDLGYVTAVGDTNTNRFMINGQKYFVQQMGEKPADFIQVDLDISLKPAEVYPGFGAEFSVNYEQKKDYGKLERKIDNLVKSKSSVLFRRLIIAKKKFLNNKSTDVVKYKIVADGVTGEQADGNIKADIIVTIEANGRQLVKDTINLSVKSDSTTVQNSGIVKGLEEMYKLFGVPSSKTKQAKDLMEDISEAQGEAKLMYVSSMFDLIGKNLSNASGKVFTDKAFKFLEEAIHGDDYAQVVDVKSSGGKIKEMTVGNLRAYKNYGGPSINGKAQPVMLQAKKSASDIRIIPVGGTDKDFLFKFRFKRRNYKDGRGQYVEKIMIETGSLAYVSSKKK